MMPAALLLGLMGIGSCSDQDAGPETVTVTIESADWSGWDEHDEGTVTTETHVAAEGESFDFERSFAGTMTATVESIENDRVVLTFNQDLAPKAGSSGWDYVETITEVTMMAGEPVGLTTPTLDAGLTYELSVEIG